MPYPNTEHELTELFRKIGAESPESWARSQLQEGIPQLHRFVFLKLAWERIIGDGDIDWIAGEIELYRKQPDGPYAGLGRSLQRMVGKGVALEDISELARCLQAQMLFSIAYLLDGPDHVPAEDLESLNWGLFETDEDGLAIGHQISGLHESVLETDPTGREMRPRDKS